MKPTPNKEKDAPKQKTGSSKRYAQKKDQMKQATAPNEQTPIKTKTEPDADFPLLGKRMNEAAFKQEAKSEHIATPKQREAKMMEKEELSRDKSPVSLSSATRSHKKTPQQAFQDHQAAFIEADDNPTRWEQLMAQQHKSAKMAAYMLELAKKSAQFTDGPRLYQLEVTKNGQPRIGQFDMAPWASADEAKNARLVKAKHLFGEGVIDFKGPRSILHNFENMKEIFLCISKMGAYPFSDQYKYTEILYDEHLKKQLKVEMALSQILAFTCSAHFHVQGHAYLNYIVSKSRRAVSEQRFPSEWQITINFYQTVMNDKVLLAIAEQVNTKLMFKTHYYHACKDRKQFENLLEQSAKAPRSIKIDQFKYPVIQGFIYRHGKVHLKPFAACYEEYRKNASLSEATIALNQALGCYSSLKLMRGGIASTAELMMMIRIQRPHLFMEDDMFTQLLANASCSPFSLDMNIFEQLLISSVGKYKDDKAENTITSVDGGLKLIKVLHGAVTPKDQSLRECFCTVKSYMQLFEAYLHHFVASGNSKIPFEDALEISKQFKSSSPILQINFTTPNGERFPFVTNVRKSEDHSNLLIRTIQGATEIVSKKALAEIALRLGIEPDEPYLDYLLAQQNPDNGKLSRGDQYKAWDTMTFPKRTNEHLSFSYEGKNVDLQREFLERPEWAACMISYFIAVQITNKLNPAMFNLDLKHDYDKMRWMNFVRGLRIESWELFVVAEERPIHMTDAMKKNLYRFVTLKSALSNEMCSHQDLTNIEKHPGLVYRLLCEDAQLVEDSICNPSSVIINLQKECEIEKPSDPRMFDTRAIIASEHLKHVKVFSMNQAATFCDKYLDPETNINLLLPGQISKDANDFSAKMKLINSTDISNLTTTAGPSTTQAPTEQNQEDENMTEDIYYFAELPDLEERVSDLAVATKYRREKSNVQFMDATITFSVKNESLFFQQNVQSKPFQQAFLQIVKAAMQSEEIPLTDVGHFVNINAQLVAYMKNSVIDKELWPVFEAVNKAFMHKQNTQDFDKMGRYWESVVGSGLVNFLMVAHDSFRDEYYGQINENRIQYNHFANSMVPTKPLLHMHFKDFADLCIQHKWHQKAFQRVHIKDTKTFWRFYDGALSLLLSWYSINGCRYHSETAQEVIMKDRRVMANFLHFIALEVIADDSLSLERAVREFEKKKYLQDSKFYHYNIVSSYQISEKGVEEFGDAAHINMQKDLHDWKYDARRFLIDVCENDPSAVPLRWSQKSTPVKKNQPNEAQTSPAKNVTKSETPKKNAAAVNVQANIGTIQQQRSRTRQQIDQEEKKDHVIEGVRIQLDAEKARTLQLYQNQESNLAPKSGGNNPTYQMKSEQKQATPTGNQTTPRSKAAMTTPGAPVSTTPKGKKDATMQPHKLNNNKK